MDNNCFQEDGAFVILVTNKKAGDNIEHFCKKCGNPLSKTQISKKGVFCSRACASSYNSSAYDPDIFEIENKHILYYIIGLIVTDGNISKNNKKLTISLTDKDVIYALSQYVINAKRRKIYSQQPKLKNASKAYTLINANPNTMQKLNEIGIMSQKTYTLKMPKIDERYVYDFLRGVFDGDGCVYISNKRYGGYYSIAIASGSTDFSNDLMNLLTQLGYSPRLVLDSRRKNSEHKTYCIKLNKQQEVARFMENIYKYADSIMIKRKYDKYYDKNMV